MSQQVLVIDLSSLSDEETAQVNMLYRDALDELDTKLTKEHDYLQELSRTSSVPLHHLITRVEAVGTRLDALHALQTGMLKISPVAFYKVSVQDTPTEPEVPEKKEDKNLGEYELMNCLLNALEDWNKLRSEATGYNPGGISTPEVMSFYRMLNKLDNLIELRTNEIIRGFTERPDKWQDTIANFLTFLEITQRKVHVGFHNIKAAQSTVPKPGTAKRSKK